MKILIATDGSEFSKTAVEECCNLIKIPEATEIKIMSVYEDVYALVGEPAALSAEIYQDLADASSATSSKFAHEAAELIRAKLGDLKIEIDEVVSKGPPEQEIVQMANEWRADLIVVGSHGRGFWGRFLGSVSDAVVHNAHCTVLVTMREGK